METPFTQKNPRKPLLIAGFVSIFLLILFCFVLVYFNLFKIDQNLSLLTQDSNINNSTTINKKLIDFHFTVNSEIDTIRFVILISFGLLVCFSGIIIRETYMTNKFKENLSVQNDDAEFLAGAKKDFIANMSHEMKTPLHAIFGVTQELVKDKNLVETHGILLDKVISSSKHMLNMVEDLLMVSNDGEIVTSFQNTSFSLSSSIQEITEDYKRKARLKGLELIVKSHVPSTVLLKGDARRLQHIISHLLDNSLKFTNHGKIEISYWLKEKSHHESNVYLQISDTGIGISEQKLKVIFQELEQGDSSITKQYPGIGLGLAITKKLVKWHGGSITVSSHEGAYTKFTISLPYNLDITSISLKKDENSNFQPSVLVVDDDEFNLILATSMLRKKNCKVETASDGNEASKLLKEKEFDVILLDIHLPRISGVGVAEELRKSNGINNNTPILAVTATLLNDDAIEKFKSAGINDWLPKPYNEVQLWEKINSLIESELAT